MSDRSATPACDVLPATITTLCPPVDPEVAREFKLQTFPTPDEFTFKFYKMMDAMRLDWGDLFSDIHRTRFAKTQKEKDTLQQLVNIKKAEFVEKVDGFFTDIKNFLTTQ